MSDLTIARTIRDQIGNKALYMLGAKNLVGGENFLQFKIRGSQTVNMIKITLDPSDTYTMEFFKVRVPNCKLVKVIHGAYWDDLNRNIEQVTGLYTKLF